MNYTIPVPLIEYNHIIHHLSDIPSPNIPWNRSLTLHDCHTSHSLSHARQYTKWCEYIQRYNMRMFACSKCIDLFLNLPKGMSCLLYFGLIKHFNGYLLSKLIRTQLHLRIHTFTTIIISYHHQCKR
jgi:hypothetical protein